MKCPGAPALAGGIPARAVASRREGPIRLKPGFPSSDIGLIYSTFISRWDTCRGSGIPPGRPDPAEAGIPVQ